VSDPRPRIVGSNLGPGRGWESEFSASPLRNVQVDERWNRTLVAAEDVRAARFPRQPVAGVSKLR
jgi:hypothetical protein